MNIFKKYKIIFIDTYCLTLFFLYRLFQKYHKFNAKEGKLIVETSNKALMLPFLTNSEYEYSNNNYFLSYLKNHHYLTKKYYFVDIGANIGYSTTDMILNHNFKNAVCIEPVKSSFDLLMKNLEINNISDKCKLINCAIGSSKKKLRVGINPQNSGDNRILSKSIRGRKSTTVDVMDFNIWLKNNNIKPQNISFISIDTQGYEFNILRSLKSNLNLINCPIMIEFWPYGLIEQGVSSKIFFQFLHTNFKFYLLIRNTKVIKYPINHISYLWEELVIKNILYQNIILLKK